MMSMTLDMMSLVDGPREKERYRACKNFLRSYPERHLDHRHHDAVWAFNFLPSQHLHPSWYPGLSIQDIPDVLWLSSRSHESLSSRILEQLQLRNQFVLDVDRPFWPLVLAPLDEFLSLVWGAALVLLSRFVRRSLSCRHIAAWKACLGEEAHHFIVQYVPLIHQERQENQVQIKYVDAFQSSRFVWIFAICALRSYLEGASRQDEGLWPRVCLKLPRDLIEESERMYNAPILREVLEIPDWITVRSVYERLLKYRSILPKPMEWAHESVD